MGGSIRVGGGEVCVEEWSEIKIVWVEVSCVSGRVWVDVNKVRGGVCVEIFHTCQPTRILRICTHFEDILVAYTQYAFHTHFLIFTHLHTHFEHLTRKC